MLADIDWTPILAALAAGLPGIVASVLGFMNRRELRTPSGDRLGSIVERTHHLAEVGAAGQREMIRRMASEKHDR